MTSTPREVCGQVLLPQGLVSVRVRFGQVIEAIELDDTAPQDVSLVPGLIDPHVHGGGGGDTMDGWVGIVQLAQFHAQHGTTSLLPATMTAPWPQVMTALRAVLDALERPFISPPRLGGQPSSPVLPTNALISEVLAFNVVRAVTIAPELPGAVKAANRFAWAGIRVGIGHTAGRFEDGVALLDEVQAAAGTHTFNAMGNIQSREPGPRAALMVHPAPFLELIVDGVHVHSGAVQLTLVAAPARILLMTDAMWATGLPDGDSELGGQAVRVHAGKATLTDGTIAGSLLTLERAVRALVQLGVPLERAAPMASTVPARSLGLQDRGEIAPGLRSHLVVFDGDLTVRQVDGAGRPLKQQVSHA